MLTIVHGSDTAQSRKYFLDEKQKHEDAVLLDAEKVTLTDLAQLFEGGSLFSEAKILFVEQFITKRKKSGDFTDIVAYFEKQAPEHMIVLWEGKDLDIGSLKTFKQPVIKAFKLPQTLFQLLDAIAPGNGKALVKLFHQTIQTTETEMVFFMLVRQFRILLALQTQPSTDNPIDELKRMAPWQKSKLQKQVQLFTSEHLLSLYRKLFHTEVAQKTGFLNAPLSTTIDFFLLEV